MPLPTVATTVFRLGTTDPQATKFNLVVRPDGGIDAITQFGSRAWSRPAAGSVAVTTDQHMVVVGRSGALPVVYRDGVLLAQTTVTAPTTSGPLSTTTADFAAFGVNLAATAGQALPGKYGRAALWPFALTPGWIAVSYAIQARSDACIGIGPEVTTGTANRPPVAVPMYGTQPELVSADYDVAQRAFDAEGDTRTTSVQSVAVGLTASVVAGKIRVRPDGGTTGSALDQPVRVSDAQGRTSNTIIRVQVGGTTPPPPPPPPVLPVGYPTPPNMASWATVTVSSNSQLASEIASATSAGKVIRLSASTNDFGSITINRPGARIAIIGLAPRVLGTITDRATLDDTDLTPTTFDDPVVENNCIVGGRAAFKAHTATNRMNLNVTACDTLWVEGVDFWSSNFNYIVNVGGQLPPDSACDQLWLRKCSFDGSDGRLLLLAGGGGTSTRVACRIFVAWECYFFADGRKRNPDVANVAKFTDYAMQLYDTEAMYFYKCIIKGGYNHGIALKAGVHSVRIDDCVFAAFDALFSPFNMLELGQEGSPTTSLDKTCGMTSVRGSTFTGVDNAQRRLVLCWFKEATGVLFDRCMFYDKITTLILGGRMPLNAGTKAETNNVNSDFGTYLAGSDDVTFTNSTFRGATPGTLGVPTTVNLTRLFSVGGGTYTFFASNNTASGTRAISTGTGVSKNLGTNARFS